MTFPNCLVAALLVVVGLTSVAGHAGHHHHHVVAAPQPTPAEAAIAQYFAKRPHRAYVAREDVDALLAEAGTDAEHLLLALAHYAAALKHFVPISSYLVGAAVRGGSGALYLGANMEVPHNSLSVSLHAEQSAIHNAASHLETSITHLAVNEAPCGLCRQFMNELGNAEDLQVITGLASAPAVDKVPLPALLPRSFGPKDLNVSAGMLDHPGWRLELTNATSDPLVHAALQAAARSYAPYSSVPAAVCIELASGPPSCGLYLENAAYNPSLAPMVAAANAAALGGRFAAGGDARRVVLVEAACCEGAQRPASQLPNTRSVLAGLGIDERRFQYVQAKIRMP